MLGMPAVLLAEVPAGKDILPLPVESKQRVSLCLAPSDLTWVGDRGLSRLSK